MKPLNMATSAGRRSERPRVAGIILAGGRGERLGGVDKSRLLVGGVALLDRTRGALAGCDPILISGAGDGQIADLATAYGGPLAGVAAGVAALRSLAPDYVLSVAVDTPFFPADFLDRALALDAPALLAAWRGQDYPTNALWAFESIADLPDRVRAGTAPHSLKRLAVEIGAQRLDYSDLAAEDPFFNVNTPADLALAQARATR